MLDPLQNLGHAIVTVHLKHQRYIDAYEPSLDAENSSHYWYNSHKRGHLKYSETPQNRRAMRPRKMVLRCIQFIDVSVLR